MMDETARVGSASLRNNAEAARAEMLEGLALLRQAQSQRKPMSLNQAPEASSHFRPELEILKLEVQRLSDELSREQKERSEEIASMQTRMEAALAAIKTEQADVANSKSGCTEVLDHTFRLQSLESFRSETLAEMRLCVDSLRRELTAGWTELHDKLQQRFVDVEADLKEQQRLIGGKESPDSVTSRLKALEAQEQKNSESFEQLAEVLRLAQSMSASSARLVERMDRETSGRKSLETKTAAHMLSLDARLSAIEHSQAAASMTAEERVPSRADKSNSSGSSTPSQEHREVSGAVQVEKTVQSIEHAPRPSLPAPAPLLSDGLKDSLEKLADRLHRTLSLEREDADVNPAASPDITTRAESRAISVPMSTAPVPVFRATQHGTVADPLAATTPALIRAGSVSVPSGKVRKLSSAKEAAFNFRESFSLSRDNSLERQRSKEAAFNFRESNALSRETSLERLRSKSKTLAATNPAEQPHGEAEVISPRQVLPADVGLPVGALAPRTATRRSESPPMNSLRKTPAASDSTVTTRSSF